jgi:hypothetical protein
VLYDDSLIPIVSLFKSCACTFVALRDHEL